MPQEAGNSLTLISLGGQIGIRGRGRIVEDRTVALGATSLEFLNENGKRLSALIVNVGAIDCWVKLGGPAAANTGILLKPAGSLQIDGLLSWTGRVEGIAAAACILAVTELSVP